MIEDKDINKEYNKYFIYSFRAFSIFCTALFSYICFLKGYNERYIAYSIASIVAVIYLCFQIKYFKNTNIKYLIVIYILPLFAASLLNEILN